MNKLEEYAKNKTLGDDWWEIEKDNCETFFVKGFNTAIALDLPVKFAEWSYDIRHKYINVEDYNIRHPEFIENGKFISTKKLYDYWITNIYNTEL